MAPINKVSLVGRLGQTPELTHPKEGLSVCSFSLAVDGGYKDKDGNWHDKTNWIPCEIWAAQAERLVKFSRVGTQIIIEGVLRIDTWETEDKQKRSKMKVVVVNFEFGQGMVKKDKEQDDENTTDKPKDDGDDLPF